MLESMFCLLRKILLVCGVIMPVSAFASHETPDTVVVCNPENQVVKNPYRFRVTQLIIPGVFSIYRSGHSRAGERLDKIYGERDQ